MNNKIDFRDVTFLLPVRIESESRRQNLEILILWLTATFDTTIHILEVDAASHVPEFVKQLTRYQFMHSEEGIFRRTRINNQLIHSCTTDFGVLLDTDVIIPPQQYLLSITALREKHHAFSLPYDGRFYRVDQNNKRIMAKTLNIDFLMADYTTHSLNTANSVGGCFLFHVEEYKKCGLENEHIAGWGHDDAERVKRLQKLGYTIFRPEGPLLHLWHERKENSRFYNDTVEIQSFETYLKVCSMPATALKEEIRHWPWTVSGNYY